MKGKLHAFSIDGRFDMLSHFFGVCGLAELVQHFLSVGGSSRIFALENG